MDGRRLLAAVVTVWLTAATVLCAGAQATPVLVMGPHGRVHRVDSRFLPATVGPGSAPSSPGMALTGAGSTPSGAGAGAVLSGPSRGSDRGALVRTPPAHRPVRHPRAQITVPEVLHRLVSGHALSPIRARGYLAQWRAALAEERRLSPARAGQLADVTELLHALAVSGAMTASRLPVLFLTLERNAQWWRSGPMLGYGQRVQFRGSELEWEYYTNEGIQLQVLGSFGEADGFYEAGRADWPKLISLVNEMIPLAVQRGGGIAWEYYFDWEGGSPPWVSAMAQATGLEALTNAYRASHDSRYLAVAHQALGLFSTPPPTGVGVRTPLGETFLQYSFAPQTDIINAFLQTLIGLDDYARVAKDPQATALFSAGNAQAEAVLPSFNLGGWSLYQPGVPDDLGYHELVTGFLQTLCGLTGTPVYCSTGQAFNADLHTPPVIHQLTLAARPHRRFDLLFTLDKPAHVGVIVTNARGRDVLYTSANCEPGTDYWVAPGLSPGHYQVRLSGTDLAGNFATVSGTLTVGTPPPAGGGGSGSGTGSGAGSGTGSGAGSGTGSESGSGSGSGAGSGTGSGSGSGSGTGSGGASGGGGLGGGA